MTRAISMLIYAGGQSLDISGPLEVFALADRQAHEDGISRAPLYRLQLVARVRAAVVLSSGMRAVPDLTCAQIDAAGIDTLLISGRVGDALDRIRADTATAQRHLAAGHETAAHLVGDIDSWRKRYRITGATPPKLCWR